MKKTWIVIAVLLLLVGGYYFFYKKKAAPAATVPSGGGASQAASDAIPSDAIPPAASTTGSDAAAKAQEVINQVVASTNAAPTTVAAIVPTVVNSAATIDWTMRENGSPNIDTNLEIQVNNAETLMQWWAGVGHIDVNQSDSVSVVACGGTVKGSPWPAPGSNTLIIQDNGVTICNKTTSTDSEALSYSFMVQGGHAYTILNYTLAT